MMISINPQNTHEHIFYVDATTPLLLHPIHQAAQPAHTQIIQSASQLVEEATQALQLPAPSETIVNIPLSAMYDQTLAIQLSKWVELGLPNEKRGIAKDRILNAAAWHHKQLDLRHLELKSLPTCIGELTHLETLNLTGNHLLTLPESLSNLVHLKHLHCNLNPIHQLPNHFGKLKKLESLSLLFHSIDRLPSSFSKLKQLNTVDFRRNLENNLPAFATLPPKLKKFWETRPSATWRIPARPSYQEQYGHVEYTLY